MATKMPLPPVTATVHSNDANKISLSKVMHVLYFISAFCVTPARLKYATLFVYYRAIIR